jgi:hypothetical protein
MSYAFLRGQVKKGTIILFLFLKNFTKIHFMSLFRLPLSAIKLN